MHPTKFLDRREPGGERVGIDFTRRIAESQAVFQGEESVTLGLFVFDGKPHEVLRRFALLPIHRGESHAVAAMQLEREQRQSIFANNLKFTSHKSPYSLLLDCDLLWLCRSAKF